MGQRVAQHIRFRTLLRLIATLHILETVAEPQSRQAINETF